MALYERDLAFVQAAAFGDLAARATPYLIARLRGARVPIKRVIDVGCGAGVTTRALVEAGFEVIAVEPSGALLEYARIAAPSARFVQASAYAIELPPCEAVLAVGEPLTYHAPGTDAQATLRAFFAKVAAALSPGGLFVFDVIEASGPSLDARAWRSADEWAILSETKEDRTTARLTRTIDTFVLDGSPSRDRYRRAREVHHVALFDEPDLRAWLEREGFDVESSRSYGDAQLAPRRIAIVATRR